ncbi:MAG: hypothetical protein ACJ710_12855 [Ornithinibacter sp.]
MTDRPDDRTQPISTGATSEQPPVGSAPHRSDAAQPTAADVPAWANATWQGDGAASARPVPVAPMAPAAGYGPSVAPVAVVAAAPPQQSWRSRVSGGRGLAVVALVVGLGLGAVGGAAATYAATHTDGTGSIAGGSGGPGGSGGFDRGGTGRFDGDGDDDFGPGGHGGPPPGGQFPDGRLPGGGQLPGGDSPQDDGTTGQLPGGGGTDANGTSQAT